MTKQRFINEEENCSRDKIAEEIIHLEILYQSTLAMLTSDLPVIKINIMNDTNPSIRKFKTPAND